MPFSPRLPTAGGIYLRKGENNKRTQILCEKEKITKEHSQVARRRKCPVAAGSFAGPRSPGLQPEAAPWPPRSRAAVNRVWSRCVSRQGVCFLLRRKTLKDEDLHPDIKTFCPMVLTSVTPLEPPAEAFFGSPLGRTLDSTAGARSAPPLGAFPQRAGYSSANTGVQRLPLSCGC